MSKYVAGSHFQTGQVRHTRSYTDFGSRPVELITPGGRGDLIEGHMRVPLRLVGTKPHTNERQEFEDYIAAQVRRWVEWREHLGWRIDSMPKVQGPIDPPIDNPLAEVPDWKEYHVRAYFRPTHPIYASFEDVYEIERQAKMFGVDLYKPKPVSSLEHKTKAVIEDNRPFHDPMKDAEERRQQYGLKREELLIGPLSEPLAKPE